MARKRDRTTFERFRRVRQSIVAELGKGPLDALEKGAHELEWKMIADVPTWSSELQASIKATGNTKRTRWKISANALNSKGIAYGQFVEFDPHFHGKGPKPFMYPAMRALKPGIRESVIEAMREAIKKGADLPP